MGSQTSVFWAARWLRALVVVAAAATRAAVPPIGSHPAVLGDPNGGNVAVFFNSNGALEEDFYFVASNTWSGPIQLPGSGNRAVFFTDGAAGQLTDLALNYFFGPLGIWSGPMLVGGTIT